MKVLKKTVPLWAVIVALLAVTSVAVAAIVVTREVGMQITISAQPEMEILDTDQSTILTSINWGTVAPGSAPSLPGGSDRYYVKNTGNEEFWISYTLAGLPSEIEFKIYFNLIDEAGAWYYPNDITTFSVPIGEVAAWYAYMPDIIGTAPAGTYTPTLTFRAHNTATG
jgi:hypothetical protein